MNAKSKTSPLRILLIVALILFAAFAGCGLVGTALYFAFAHEEVLPVTDADEELLVTATELVELYEGMDIDESYGQVRKVRFMDGSGELSYEYDDPREESSLYMNVTMAYEPKKSDAKLVFATYHAGMGLGMTLVDDQITRKPCAELFSYGEVTKCDTVEHSGNTVGTIYGWRAGRHAYFLTVIGGTLDDKDAVEGLVGDKLKRMGAWRPRR